MDLRVVPEIDRVFYRPQGSEPSVAQGSDRGWIDTANLVLPVGGSGRPLGEHHRLQHIQQQLLFPLQITEEHRKDHRSRSLRLGQHRTDGTRISATSRADIATRGPSTATSTRLLSHSNAPRQAGSCSARQLSNSQHCSAWMHRRKTRRSTRCRNTPSGSASARAGPSRPTASSTASADEIAWGQQQGLLSPPRSGGSAALNRIVRA